MLWPHRAPRDPQAALRPILSRLRRALGPDALEGRERLRLRLPEPVWTDVGAATARSRRRAGRRARPSSGGSTRAHAGAALDLLRPGFLPGVDDEWAGARRRESRSSSSRRSSGSPARRSASAPAERGAAERAGRELVARSPFRETGHRFLMEALAGAGNIAEALRVYDDLRVLLRDELGTAPAAGAPGAAPAAARRRGRAGEEIAPGSRRRSRSPAGSRRASAPRSWPAIASSRLLREAWGQARARAAAGVVVLAGEPGIGKTRLAREFADVAHADGAVLYAACQEEALVAYQPFVEALRGAGLDWERIAAMPGAGELARVIPELPAAPDGRGRGTPELQRYLLFEAVSALLDDIAGRAPARARARRPALGRPRHAAPAAPRRPRTARRPAAGRRHLPRRRGPRGATRSPSCWPTCAATGWSSASRSRAWASATSAR